MKISSVLSGLVCFVACSESNFSSANKEEILVAAQSPTDQSETIILETSEEGLIGGHFDLDTSSAIYGFNEGTTDGHVHEYDDKFQVNGADFFRLQDKKLVNIQDQIPADKNFIIHVVNSKLSPGGVIEINGELYSVGRYSQNPNVLKQIYSLGGENPLTSLSIRFKKDAILSRELIGTDTGCVRNNNPGKLNEYRNGALLIQVLDANGYTLDTQQGFATSGLLWEASLFWHHDNGCYL